MKYKIIFLLLIFYNYISYSSVFDKINWMFHSERNNIKLFKTNDRFYKVETVFNYKKIEDIVLFLTTREYYLKIFPKTREYKKIEKLNNNKYLIYEVISFSPFKSRDCFLELEINNLNNEWIIEWYPAKEEIVQCIEYNAENVHVKNIYGRWIIKKINNDNIYVSMEFFNDFKFKISEILLLNIEREESFKILKDLKVFLNKEKKFCYNE